MAGATGATGDDWSAFGAFSTSKSVPIDTDPSVTLGDAATPVQGVDSWTGFDRMVVESPPPFSPDSAVKPNIDNFFQSSFPSLIPEFSKPAETPSLTPIDSSVGVDDNDEWSAFGEPPPFPPDAMSESTAASGTLSAMHDLNSIQISNESQSDEPPKSSNINIPIPSLQESADADAAQDDNSWSAFAEPPPFPDETEGTISPDMMRGTIGEEEPQAEDDLSLFKSSTQAYNTPDAAAADHLDRSRSSSPESSLAFSPPPLSDKDFSPMKSAGATTSADWFSFPDDRNLDSMPRSARHSLRCSDLTLSLLVFTLIPPL